MSNDPAGKVKNLERAAFEQLADVAIPGSGVITRSGRLDDDE